MLFFLQLNVETSPIDSLPCQSIQNENINPTMEPEPSTSKSLENQNKRPYISSTYQEDHQYTANSNKKKRKVDPLNEIYIETINSLKSIENTIDQGLKNIVNTLNKLTDTIEWNVTLLNSSLQELIEKQDKK